MKKLTSMVCCLLMAVSLFAQTPTGGVTGSIVSRAGRLPIPGASLIIQKDGQTIATSVAEKAICPEQPLVNVS